MTAQDYGLARRMWHQLEPVHAVFWYAPVGSLARQPLGRVRPPDGDAFSPGSGHKLR
jgi:hypothetical protein